MTTNFVSLLTDSTTTSGTGNVTTSGTVTTGYVLLAGVGPVGTKFDYRIGAPGAAEWEEGEGKVLSATSFSRTPLDSSNNGALVNFSAGTKAVAHGPIASRMRKLHQRTSPRWVYLSAYCESDTVLDPYAPVAGVDQRALIQAVMDIPNVRIIGDIRATVANVPGTSYIGNDADTLLQRSNTVVAWLPGCGLLQAAGSKGDMWKNANPTTTANNNHAAITDEKIALIGGIFHGNRDGQNNVKMDVLRFSGVRNLYTEGYTVYRASGMGVRVINIDGWTNKDYTVEQGKDLLTADNSISINTDGVHVHGPARGIRDTNGRWLNCGDDSYALNADDAWSVPGFTFAGRFDNVFGDITDVVVESPYLSARYFGIRLLSGNSRIDRVFFHNVTGSTSASAFRVDNYLTPSQMKSAGPGNVGLVVVDGWNVTTSMVDFAWGQMAMTFDCKIEELRLRNITKRDFNNAFFPAIQIGEKADINLLKIPGYSSRNYNGGTYLADQINFASGSKVNQVRIEIDSYAGSATNGSPVRVRAGATIQQMVLDGMGQNFTSTLLNEGTIKFLHDRSFMDTPIAIASTFTAQGGTGGSTGWNENASDPTTLSYTGPVSGVVRSIKKNTNDAYGGNVQLSVDITVSGTVNPNHHDALFARGTNTVPWSGVQACYYFDLQYNNSGTNPALALHRVVGGVDTTLWTTTTPLVAGTKYTAKLTPKNSLISVSLQRVSDGYYVQPNGTFSATVANAASATDTGVPAVAGGGEWGLYSFMDGASSTAFSNISLTAAP